MPSLTSASPRRCTPPGSSLEKLRSNDRATPAAEADGAMQDIRSSDALKVAETMAVPYQRSTPTLELKLMAREPVDRVSNRQWAWTDGTRPLALTLMSCPPWKRLAAGDSAVTLTLCKVKLSGSAVNCWPLIETVSRASPATVDILGDTQRTASKLGR